MFSNARILQCPHCFHNAYFFDYQLPLLPWPELVTVTCAYCHKSFSTFVPQLVPVLLSF